ncbi:hypothetical protein GCM10018793_66700 [Streptomyces sulfonofaciens]|uniref:Uncharacterized protein n=1 Tax=Streptomyces sulfonofaciens TaxID=68272 RepID=A0A919GPB7_9ACTN|nr:hypothetical protein GCM10018793_66700 [Streptomyces sulfonofaciens]
MVPGTDRTGSGRWRAAAMCWGNARTAGESHAMTHRAARGRAWRCPHERGFAEYIAAEYTMQPMRPHSSISQPDSTADNHCGSEFGTAQPVGASHRAAHEKCAVDE